ncbi:WD repeat-containing protein 78-like isoform X1 [Acyrthosiphon pisum]|uniref:Dynein axonemal intermediate chain 4 n=1 Tax=Acyrthosiphon pisum TaxID=7029 RepID=A0A8R2H585_ACYPI|nr:WD repeat-containing protein 78-like isoform X1 [Acyrthosiphon pisum]|eukprot:XP_016659241.1 PREDICTED: WD repeat-containing protein 78-like isoform X1 [Acyrthosiphon pisum]
MDNNKFKTQKLQQKFHFDEHNIEKICTSLENEIENLKVVKIQNQPFQTPDVQFFKAALQETKTNTLLELPSLAPSVKNISNTSQNEIAKTNTTKYLLTDAVQASRCFQRTQHTQTEAITLKDQSNIASVWILQKEIGNNMATEKIEDIKSNNFKKMLFISDRIVTSNNFSEKQIKFITRHTSDKLNAMSYRYTLEEILQFSNDKLSTFSVTSFVWNTMNEDILAVGYGKWNDEPNGFKGAVCCWSLKNPVYPERMYEFNKPITCLDFSKTHANILVAGSHGGCVYILDIAPEICDPVIVNEKNLQNFPIWSVLSFLQKSYTSEDEFILSVDDNGSVRKWSGGVSKTYNTEQMSLIYCGIRNDSAKPNKFNHSTIVQNMPGTVISFHPTNKSTYFIGTKVGFVVQNTVDSCNHYDRIFMAHNGPVYGIKFSPFCSSIFITYGADWQIKIWMENVDVPLLSLSYCNAVDDADWSPINSTVIVSVSGAVICIWDFARKTVEPVMMFTCKTGVHFSLVKFSKHGNNIVTGDVNGLVRCFHISNMPSPSFLQKNSILTALENMMSSNHELVQIIKKTMMNN